MPQPASAPLRSPPFVAGRARLQRLKDRLGLMTAADRSGGQEKPERGPTLGPLLIPAALNEIRAEATGDRPAAIGFALALAGARARTTGAAITWITTDDWAAQEGTPYPPALAAAGIDLSAFLAIFVSDEKSLLWAAEETARSSAIAAAIIDAPDASRRLDLTATRRLHLAAETSGAALLLLRTKTALEPSAAFRRWHVRPTASAADPDDDKAPGDARWRITLERCRAGGRGHFIAEHAHDAEPLLRPAPEDALHRASDALFRDRSAPTRRAG